MALKHAHLFFICEKKSANIGGVDYDYYEITKDAETYYMMEYGWPHPPGFTVYRATLLANSGLNYMLHFHTTDTTKANIAGSSDQYAGGGISKYYEVALASAHESLIFLSVNQKGVHAAFPPQAVIKLIIPCQWTDGGSQSGTYGDWLDAGAPAEDFRANPIISLS